MSIIYIGSRIPISIYTNYNNDLYIYQDPYQYTDTDFYPLVSSEFGGQFDEELDERITLIKSMEQVKIFKGVDLQRMVQRFNAQQKYIKAAEKGEFVEPLVLCQSLLEGYNFLSLMRASWVVNRQWTVEPC